jgi:N4-gp56 family major capsid protein
MGAAATTTNPADFANRLQKYYSRQLLKALQYNLRLAAYGQAKEVPANSAANQIRFFRPRKASRAGVQALTEATAPANLTEVAVGYVDATLKQRGALAKVSDIVRGIDLFDTVDVYTKTMGADAALDYDMVCNHAICSNAGVADSDGTANPIPAGVTTLYGSNTSFERFAGVANTGVSANDFATLAAATSANSKITRAVHLGCITQLKKNNVPMVNGKYPVICPPEILFDIRQDATWVSAAVFDAARLRSLFQWAEFELDGGIFVEQNNPFREDVATYGTYNPAGGLFSVLYLGDGAFGVPKLSGSVAGSNPASPSIILLTQPDKADPLNQVVTLGWKAYYTAILLWTNEASDLPHAVQLRCKSTFI